MTYGCNSVMQIMAYGCNFVIQIKAYGCNFVIQMKTYGSTYWIQIMKYGRLTMIVWCYLLIEIPDFLSNERVNDYCLMQS
jgi:hypothetical protein